MAIPNPLCACGCGWEVALPWNKYIQTHHNAPDWSDELRAELQQMLDDGVSTYKIAAKAGRTQGIIMQWKFLGLPSKKAPAPKICRRSDVDEEITRLEEREWRKAKLTLKQIKSLLRDPQKLHEAESRQGQTSQTS